MDELLFQQMQEICESAGFVRKGKVFFRVLGDGVLQVVKCQYERAFQSYLIYVGLQSMYAQLQPKHFTAGGCMANYSVIQCYYLNRVPVVFASPMEGQLEMMKNGVLPWLSTIDTQKKLVTAISKLDNRWNDTKKIGPFLACGEYNHAKKVIKEIIGAYSFAMVRSVAPRDVSVADMVEKARTEDTPFYGIIELIDMGETAVSAYLQANFEANMSYAKSIVKKQKESQQGESV